VLITNHVLAGALVGVASPGPVSAFVLGAASHFALDVVPHFGDLDDDQFLPVAVVDGLVGLAALRLVWRRTAPGRRGRVLAGMLGSCAPDTDKPSQVFFHRSPFPAAWDDFHARIQRESRRRLPQEVAVAALGALLVRSWVTAPGR
jgi:hypothetical protein